MVSSSANMLEVFRKFHLLVREAGTASLHRKSCISIVSVYLSNAKISRYVGI
jgi:hypothetical protein